VLTTVTAIDAKPWLTLVISARSSLICARGQLGWCSCTRPAAVVKTGIANLDSCKEVSKEVSKEQSRRLRRSSPHLGGVRLRETAQRAVYRALALSLRDGGGSGGAFRRVSSGGGGESCRPGC